MHNLAVNCAAALTDAHFRRFAALSAIVDIACIHRLGFAAFYLLIESPWLSLVLAFSAKSKVHRTTPLRWSASDDSGSTVMYAGSICLR
jgi:hypothetical protein